MPDENSPDLAVTIAQEVVKQVPLKEFYADGLSPATKETGGLLSDLVKTVRLALAPIQYLAVQQDRFRNFIEDSARRVPETNRVSPAPQILGPIIEAIRYEPEGSLSDEAFSHLLSRAFDRERLGQAHPAFPNIIRSLSDDELTLLKHLKKGTKFEMPSCWMKGDEVKRPNTSDFDEKFHFLRFPSQVLVYTNHIEALGLIETLMGSDAGQIDEEGYTLCIWKPELSQFGELFVDAVL